MEQPGATVLRRLTGTARGRDYTKRAPRIRTRETVVPVRRRTAPDAPGRGQLLQQHLVLVARQATEADIDRHTALFREMAAELTAT